MNIILQKQSTFETRAIRTAAMLLDNVSVLSYPIEGLRSLSQILYAGAMPVGSVEFVREAMKVAGIQEPVNMSYPDGCNKYLYRDVRQIAAGHVLGRWFVKPVETKVFTGFVFDTMQDPLALSEHDQEQHAAFLSMAPDSLVWISEPVQWLSEWRYYVTKKAIIGKARYDPNGDDGAPEPNEFVIKECISDLPFEHSYALDFGVLATGETALVEANDAWAIGLYSGALSPRDYLHFLSSRWSDIRIKLLK